MENKIRLIYVDDKLDSLLSEYLFQLSEEGTITGFDEYEFNSQTENYQTLLYSERIKNSDIIVIDSKLFENEFAFAGSKFTGQEFKLIQKLLNPFVKVIVITQNKDLNKYGVLNKFPTSKAQDSQEDANDFYDGEGRLREAIESAVKEICAFRATGTILEINQQAYEGSNIVEKVQNLLNKVPTYHELTDKKIDELIEIIKKDILKSDD